MYKMMNMEHSMQFADHPLITLIAPIFQLCVTVMKKKAHAQVEFTLLYLLEAVSVWLLII